MRRKETVPPVSMRRGKLRPSVRYADPEASQAAMKTNWRLGIDAPLFESTSHASSKNSASVPPEVLALRQPRIDKNSSNKDAIQGDQRSYDPKNTYSTTYLNEYTRDASTCASTYQKQAPQFDRASANKTNYDIATSKTHYDLRASSHVYHASPASWQPREGFEKAVIGGWTRQNGEYVQDEHSRGAIIRGGGGGEGSLGLRFDIITNRDRPNARNDVLMRTGPRACSVDAWRAETDRYGELPEGRTVNVLTGKVAQVPNRPYQQTVEDLRRPDVPVLRTRPW